MTGHDPTIQPLFGDRPFRVAVLGTWNWLHVAAELLRRAGVEPEIVDLRCRKEMVKWVLTGQWRRYHAIHHVRGTNWHWGTTFSILRKPIIWHWIGTDLLHFQRDCVARRAWRPALTRRAAYHWARAHVADSPRLVAELDQLGIHAGVVRLLPEAVEAKIEPLPDAPCVMSYWAPETREFYHCTDVMRLAGAFPSVRFLIAGDAGLGISAPPNVKFLGRLPNLEDVYPRVSILIRLVQHDSLSAMVLEALARGRYVVYSEEFPHTQHARSYDEAKEAIAALIGKTTPHTAGSQYVHANFSLREQAEALRSLYARLFASHRAGPQG